MREVLTMESGMELLKITEDVKKFIRDFYSEPHRLYHNTKHLDNMLRWVDPCGENAKCVILAALFHDIAYGSVPVAAGFNEALSVWIFSQVIDVQTKPIVDIVEAINATAYHDRDQPLLGSIAQQMLDLDLQSFAQSRQEFYEDNQNVLLELAIIHGKEKNVREGNRAFLTKMLERKKLYYTRPEWEDMAQANIRWLLEQPL